MIRGMTGFGTAQFVSGTLKATVEIKSLNHRFFDINYYLPTGFGALENKIRQLVQKDVERGRITISIKITEKPVQKIVLNKDVAKKYLTNAKSLNKEFGLEFDLRLSDLVKFPGVMETKETPINVDSLWRGLDQSIKKALAALIVMRKREGRSLAADVGDKLRRMTVQVKKIQMRSKSVLKEKKKILADDEFCSYQRSNDINEEIARLAHYIDEIKILLKSNVSVGKKIDFIAQEMQRETNTIGSKLQDKIVSNAVIALKSKIEKIREQSQNVE